MQINVNNAFFHAYLIEDISMCQPPGFKSPTPNLVYKLRKALYGLKQASLAWFQKLHAYLINLAFVDSKADSSLLIKLKVDVMVFILIYVDDILIISTHCDLVDQLIVDLNVKFSLKNLGLLYNFLGVDACFNNGYFHLSQQKYIKDLLESIGLIDIKLVATPMS